VFGILSFCSLGTSIGAVKERNERANECRVSDSEGRYLRVHCLVWLD
jgi:hypothetical protein